MRNFRIHDEKREILFRGDLLAESSSRHHGSGRWVEFRLYRTEAGTYVIERVGRSMIFHGADCSVIERNHLQPAEVPFESIACDLCNPSGLESLLYPERDRPWVMTTETATGVLDAVYKYDADTGSRYITKVVANLLNAASEVDEDIADAYHFEVIA